MIKQAFIAKSKIPFLALIVFLLILPATAVDPHILSKLTRIKSDPNQVEFISGNVDDGSHSVMIQTTDYVFTKSQSAYVFYDSLKIYITPKYRTEKLAKANKKTNNKIEKLKEKIQKYSLEGKDISTLIQDKLQLEQSLFIAKEIDSSSNPKILLFLAGHNFIKHNIVGSNNEVICEPLSVKQIPLNKDLQVYFKEIYSTNTKLFQKIVAVDYDPQCFSSKQSIQEKIIFKSKSYNSYFSHNYIFYASTLKNIRDEYGIQ